MAWTAVHDQDNVIELDLQRSAFLQETIEDAVSVPPAHPNAYNLIRVAWVESFKSALVGTRLVFFGEWENGVLLRHGRHDRTEPGVAAGNRRHRGSRNSACRQSGNKSIGLSRIPF